MVIKKNITKNTSLREVGSDRGVTLRPMGDRKYHFSSLESPDNFDFLGITVMEKYKLNSSEYSSLTPGQKETLLSNITSDNLREYTYSFKLQIPMVEKESASNNSNIKMSNYSLSPFYNYYAKQYEDIMTDFSSMNAPNCYVAMRNGIIDQDSTKRHFSNKRISTKLFKKIISKNTGRFFPQDRAFINATRNMMFNRNYNPAVASYIKHFPFGMRLSFDHYHQNEEFIKTFTKLDMLGAIMSNYESVDKFKIKMMVEIPGEEDQQEVMYHAVDLLKLLTSSPLMQQKYDNQYIVSDTKPHSKYGDILRSGLLKAFMGEAIKNLSTSYHDYMSSKETYSEVLFYKIDKYLGNNASGQPVQTIYIPADNMYASYYDTQVRYGESYTYSAKAVMVCIGSMFTLSEEKMMDDSAEITIENRPQVLLGEVPLFEEASIMSATPPLVPFVDFYTKNDSHNEINIRMNMPVGIRYDNFIQFEDSDILQIDMMNKPKGSDLYIYGYHSIAKMKYDVYRLHKPPSSYEDFKNQRYLEGVEANIKDVLNFTDRVRPNQKYYYMFRAVNQYGMKSNPTPIYCVELLKDSDNSKIMVDTYEFPEQKVSQQNIMMKRLMQIIPAPQHTIFDSENIMTQLSGQTFNNSLDRLKYGIAEKPIWGRKFKIRVTSNDTGRKIDINVLFNLIKKKANEDLN